MWCKRAQGERGITLIEVVMAVAIFTVVMGVTASSLSSFYVTMDTQEQRIEAVQSCRAVLGAMRDKRSQYELPSDGFDWAGYHAWIQSQEAGHWEDYLRINTDHEELRDHSLAVACLNLAGAAATAADDPIEVHVTATWTDRQGRAMQAQLVSVLTSR
jgi:type II secretory pathway pseudopilin PulG